MVIDALGNVPEIDMHATLPSVVVIYSESNFLDTFLPLEGIDFSATLAPVNVFDTEGHAVSQPTATVSSEEDQSGWFLVLFGRIDEYSGGLSMYTP